jgi:hypothetical protein
MGKEVSITVLATGFTPGPASVKVESSDSVLEVEKSPSTSIGAERDVNFYKERRQLTRSPLGVSESVENTRKAVTRGLDMTKVLSEDSEPPLPKKTDDDSDEKTAKGVVSGFFRRLRRKK